MGITLTRCNYLIVQCLYQRDGTRIGETFFTGNSTIDVLPLSIAVSDFYTTQVLTASCLCRSFLNNRPLHHFPDSGYTATTVSVSPAESAFIYARIRSRVRYRPNSASSCRRTMGKVLRT